MTNTTAYPLQWPNGFPRTTNPIESRFGKYGSRPTTAFGTNALQHELRRLGASNVVISTNLTLRNDGLPRSSQRAPEDAGVAVYFTKAGEQRVIACDKWRTVGENIYAIAKSIEAMRGIDRWGCSDMLNRMFNGFKALPEKAGEGAASWWDVLGVSVDATKSEIIAAYRKRGKETHPDLGGDAEEFNRVVVAYKQATE